MYVVEMITLFQVPNSKLGYKNRSHISIKYMYSISGIYNRSIIKVYIYREATQLEMLRHVATMQVRPKLLESTKFTATGGKLPLSYNHNWASDWSKL